jgi:cyclopropane-fatty-acyl-phospholipid synthase
MQNIDKGQLRVLTYSNIYTFPAKAENEPLKAELRVINDVFWVRLCTMGDLGFAESYMYGEVECDDLVSLFQVDSPLSTRSYWCGSLWMVTS